MGAYDRLIPSGVYAPLPRLAAGLLAAAGMLTTTVAGTLPDTGQTSCYNTSTTTDCVNDSSYPRQDGSQVASLGYTKLDAAGSPLDGAAPTWACVRDNATGLVWEVKTADSALRGGAHRYAWYEADSLLSGGQPGAVGVPATCAGSMGLQPCNTADFLAAVNATNLCGASDWRLPTQMELLTLVHAGAANPTIDTGFFPNTVSAPYWSASPYAMNPANAWAVHFGYGAAHAEGKNAAHAVRLVRGTWSR